MGGWAMTGLSSVPETPAPTRLIVASEGAYKRQVPRERDGNQVQPRSR